MIYRVGDEITTYDYNTVKSTKQSGNGEKFDLDLYRETKKEDKGEKTEEKSSENVSTRSAVDGVKLELSTVNAKTDTNKQKRTDLDKSQQISIGYQFAEGIKKFIASFLNFFDRIWNEQPKEEKTGSLEEADIKVVEKPKLAKNSTLLTYYDRQGKIKEVNVSDRERILHGDRNTKKL